MPQVLKPAHLDPVLRNERSHRSEKAVRHSEEQPPPATAREKPASSKEDPVQPT